MIAVDKTKLIRIGFKVVMIGVIFVGLTFNYIWWRIGLPYCINTHSDNFLFVAFVGSVLVVICDIIAIIFGIIWFNEFENAFLENQDEKD